MNINKFYDSWKDNIKFEGENVLQENFFLLNLHKELVYQFASLILNQIFKNEHWLKSSYNVLNIAELLK